MSLFFIEKLLKIVSTGLTEIVSENNRADKSKFKSKELVIIEFSSTYCMLRIFSSIGLLGLSYNISPTKTLAPFKKMMSNK